MNKKVTLDNIKQQLDIVTIAENYGELVKTGSNFKYKHDSSIVINPAKQIFSNFNGEIRGGDVINLISYMGKITLKEAISEAKKLVGIDDYRLDVKKYIPVQSQKKKIDLNRLAIFAKNDLNESLKKQPFLLDNNGIKKIMIHVEFSKLLETQFFDLKNHQRLLYIFKNIVGFDNFYKCPSIIIRDPNGTIVDKISYRPNKPAHYENWSNPKYIYKNQSNRGNNFLFPFQTEIEKIIKREKYLIVGEGIKNALNSLVYKIPFLTFESSSSNIDERVITYIKELYEDGVGVICMFDGDGAGKKAFETFKEKIGLPLENHLNFSSEIDFTDYLVGENNE
jgi:hypothetical protein